jgi:hypothetical protein
MASPTPLITGSGSQSIKNGRKSLRDIHVPPDRHESEIVPASTSSKQDPISIVETTSHWQDKPSNESATTQRKRTSASRSYQDLEQGIEPARETSRPSITIIDVDDRGVRTSPWRGWADGPEVERPGRDTDSPSIRITLVDRKPTKKESDKIPEGLRPERLESYLVDDGVGKMFCMLSLQALFRTEETGPSFFLQTNALPSAADWHNGTPLQPDSNGFGFGCLFWELYTKLGFRFSEDLKVEGR